MLELAGGAVARTSGMSSGDGQWTENPPPPGRDGQSAIYDPVRHRMVVFGGYDGYQLLDELWALSLTDVPTWTILAASGTPPSARYRHSAIYDPVRDRMVVFGGEDPGGRRNDLWTLSLSGIPTWSSITAAGSAPRPLNGHTAIYDPAGDRMVVFGGNWGGGILNGVWALSLAGTPTWSALAAAGPPPIERELHTALYDPVRQRMVIFGGRDFSGPRNDVWALSLAGTLAWSALAPSGTLPSARYGHTAIYDPAGDRMLVFGGFNGTLKSWNDIWALSLGTAPSWTALNPVGGPPDGRYGHCAVYDTLGERMLVFAGRFVNGRCHDTWALSLAGDPAWSNPIPAAASLPAANFLQSAIYDSVRNRMVVFGGYEGIHDQYYNDVWTLSLSDVPAWSTIVPSGTGPGPRCGHTAMYDPLRDRMVVFGGRGSSGYLSDVWTLSFGESPTWTPLLPSGGPAPRWQHTATYDPVRDRMVIFGGSDGTVYRNDVWALSFAGASTWSVLAPSGTPPSARYGHTAIYDALRDRMVVFGGTSQGPYLNDVWLLTFADIPAWTSLSPSGTPPAGRYGHTSVYDAMRDRMVVFAGLGNVSFRDTWALSFAGTPTWSALAPAGTPPAARCGHTAIYDREGNRMVVLGGDQRHDMWMLAWGMPLSVPDTRGSLDVVRIRPNPSRLEMNVEFDLRHAGRVMLEVIDVHGRRVKQVADGWLRGGHHVSTWQGVTDDGRPVAPGVYFIRMMADGLVTTRRAVWVR